MRTRNHDTFALVTDVLKGMRTVKIFLMAKNFFSHSDGVKIRILRYVEAEKITKKAQFGRQAWPPWIRR